MIGIVDYGAGNIGSLSNALSHLRIEHKVASAPEKLSLCDAIILPGVGAFHAAIQKLEKFGLISFLKDWAISDKPFLGICLGMQLMLDLSEEDGKHDGLGLIKGKVSSLSDPPRSIHIGWNLVKPVKEFGVLQKTEYAYFVHAYACYPEDSEITVGVTKYGDEFTSIFKKRNMIGVQFHPEKSQMFGLKLLKEFSDKII